MLSRIKTLLFVFAMLAGAAGPAIADENDPESKAGSAVANILFDTDASEFVSYKTKSDGSVDVTFANNTPDAIYSDILNKLQTHPDIKRVLAGKNGPRCSRF